MKPPKTRKKDFVDINKNPKIIIKYILNELTDEYENISANLPANLCISKLGFELSYYDVTVVHVNYLVWFGFMAYQSL